MGNGPSLNKMDLDLLADETVFAANAAYFLFPRIGWRPRYYSCVDSRVLPDTANEISAMLRAHPEMDGFFPFLLHIYDGTGRTIETKTLLPRLPNIHYFAQQTSDPGNLPDSTFTLGLGRPFCTPKTVTLTLMQLAVMMGFRELYLIGCDTSYAIPKTVHQSGPEISSGTGERQMLTSTEDDDPNHFSPEYFGRGRKWHHPKVNDMQWHYAQAKEVLDSAGVTVFNATVGGKLEVFPRVDYRAVLQA